MPTAYRDAFKLIACSYSSTIIARAASRPPFEYVKRLGRIVELSHLVAVVGDDLEQRERLGGRLHFKVELPGQACLPVHDVCHRPMSIIQTEAERRRCKARVQQAMENGLRSCRYVCF